MNRAPVCSWIVIFLIPAFPDQTDNQRDQEEGNADDARREPDPGAEDTELLRGIIVTILTCERGRIPIHKKPNHTDHNQKRTDKHQDGAGFFLPHSAFFTNSLWIQPV